MVGLVFVMVARIICGQYRPVQRSSLSICFANSYGVHVSNNLCVDIPVCGRHYVRKNLGVAWEQGYWFHTPLGEKWSG